MVSDQEFKDRLPKHFLLNFFLRIIGVDEKFLFLYYVTGSILSHHPVEIRMTIISECHWHLDFQETKSQIRCDPAQH